MREPRRRSKDKHDALVVGMVGVVRVLAGEVRWRVVDSLPCCGRSRRTLAASNQADLPTLLKAEPFPPAVAMRPPTPHHLAHTTPTQVAAATSAAAAAAAAAAGRAATHQHTHERLLFPARGMLQSGFTHPQTQAQNPSHPAPRPPPPPLKLGLLRCAAARERPALLLLLLLFPGARARPPGLGPLDCPAAPVRWGGEIKHRGDAGLV